MTIRPLLFSFHEFITQAKNIDCIFPTMPHRPSQISLKVFKKKLVLNALKTLSKETTLSKSFPTEQTISLAICEERKYGSIFLLFPLNRIFKKTQKEWIDVFVGFFFFLRYLDVLQKEGGRLIWHGTRLVGVYLMLSGWSADRRKKAFFLSASSYDKQDLAKKATSPLTARRFSL